MPRMRTLGQDPPVPAVSADYEPVTAPVAESRAIGGEPPGSHRAALATTLGDPREQVLRSARECDAAFVVVGTRGRGAMRGALLGTLSRSLAVRGDTPLVVVQPEAAAGLRGSAVVCGVAGSLDEALPALEMAADLAARLQLRLAVAHALDPNRDLDTQDDLSLSAVLDVDGWRALSLTGRLVAEVGDCVGPHAVLRRGNRAQELARLARERDAALIVVGSHRHGPVRTPLAGSLSVDLCRFARHPVGSVPLGAAGAG